MEAGYNINDLVREAQTRWLKPAEVLFILQNHENDQITHEPPKKPTSGSLFLFNKRVLRFFRKDGHSWRKKRDGRTVGEAHERLKVGNVEALNCYYAHGEQNPNFQRRSFWMLDPEYEHIVLVHYRDISEGRQNAGFTSLLSPTSPALTQSPSFYTSQQPSSSVALGESYEPHQSLSSPGSVEISSDAVTRSNGMRFDVVDRTEEISNLSQHEMNKALRRLEEQLSLNDDSFEEIGPIYSDNENLDDLEYVAHDDSTCGLIQDDLKSLQSRTASGENSDPHQELTPEVNIWKEMLDSSGSYSNFKPYEEEKLGENQDVLPSTSEPEGEQDGCIWFKFDENDSQNSSISPLGEVKYSAYSPAINTYGTDSHLYGTLFNQSQIDVPLEDDMSLTSAQKKKFTIREISPDWGYASQATKVIIVGSFLCDPSEYAWTCMFGDAEVPIQIIQEGVVCCQAPPHVPGKVTVCMTAANRESCSEIKMFDYRSEPHSFVQNNPKEAEISKSTDELLLLVRLAQMVLSDSSVKRGDSSKSGNNPLGKFKACEDLWSQLLESVLAGTSTPSMTMDWILQELLKDKLQLWLSSKLQDENNQVVCSLSKKEQGMIHMIAGLGLEWALYPIINAGVSVNFRDINGWTALHWAARFGREKMVAALIAQGASAGAVTDPSPQDPVGKTAAFIAASCGHKGLAGYLSEVALTSHLSSLTLEESELSRGCANIEADKTVNSISGTSVSTYEDQLSLKDTLAAVRNAAQAAARIQAAFRAHSFRRRQQRETVVVASGDEYSFLTNDIQGLSAASKLAFRNARDYNSAALSIQKKYRGWKGRKDFLAFRQKVVKIQAHVRGYQVRKQYKVCWAVGVLEKVVLRWRRRGVGLRGFRNENESIDEAEDEDILKVFRKQKVEAAIDEAVSRVLSMVESPDARQQYRRILEKYRQAKAELEGAESDAASTARVDIYKMEDEIYQFA